MLSDAEINLIEKFAKKANRTIEKSFHGMFGCDFASIDTDDNRELFMQTLEAEYNNMPLIATHEDIVDFFSACQPETVLDMIQEIKERRNNI